MTLHLLRIVGITMLIVLCMLYPFLPGKYDGLAMPLSTIVQLFGTTGLLLVPIGLLWLVYEIKKRAQSNRDLQRPIRGYYFGMASLIAASIIAILVSLGVLIGFGISFGVITLALWLYVVARLVPRLKLLKKAEGENIDPTPFYLILIPLAALLFQVMLAAPVTKFSRNYAITQSVELINEIENHRAVHGRYPSSLLAVWKDYYPGVVGTEGFHYAPRGDAYNLMFEQPRFLLDNLGTREFVVYNKLDEHVMPSHAAWLLRWTPEQLERRQGWFAVHDASSPHWKYFWFD